jgi:hypothetical protein
MQSLVGGRKRLQVGGADILDLVEFWHISSLLISGGSAVKIFRTTNYIEANMNKNDKKQTSL